MHRLAHDLLTNAIKIVVAGAGLKASHSIEQRFAFVDGGDGAKRAALEALLDADFDGGRVLLFCATKKGADALTRTLRTAGWPAMAIHGDKCQLERDWVLRVRRACAMHRDTVACTAGAGALTCPVPECGYVQEFREGNSPIMLATDVAARGLGARPHLWGDPCAPGRMLTSPACYHHE